MAFPATGIIDDFNRADASPLVAPWSGTGIETAAATGLGVLSNQLKLSGGTVFTSFLTADYGPDVEAYATVATLPVAGDRVTLYGRLASAGGSSWSGYYMIWFKGTTTDAWSVRKRVGGTTTTIQTFSTSLLVAGDKVGMDIRGSTIRAFKFTSGAWSQVGTDVTDTDISAAGKIGIEVNITGSRVDDFGGGTVVPFPTTGVLDNFNRADASVSGVSPWAALGIDSSNTTDLAVASNQLRITVATTINGYLTATYGPNVELYCTVPTLPPAGEYVALFARGNTFGSGSSWEGYLLVWIKGTPDTWSLRKRVGGTNTTLSAPTSTTISAGDKIGMSIIGSTIKMWKFTGGIWVQVGTDVTDTDLTAAGLLGIEISSTTTRVDDLGGGTVAAATGATVSAAPAVATGVAPPVNSLISAVVGVPAAGATGKATAPGVTSIGAGGSMINAPAAVASGKAPPANSLISGVVNVPAAGATGKATAPSVVSITSSATVSAVPARANGKATAPFIPGLPVLYDFRSLTTTSGTGTSFTLATPAGATSTDALFIFVVHGAGVSIPGVPPGGWSLGTPSAFNTNSTARVIQTTALATSGPWTFTFSASTSYVAAAVAITVDSSVVGAQRPVIDTALAKITAPTTGAFVFPAITPSNTGDVVMWLGGWSRYTTFTPPAGVTERADLANGTSSTSHSMWIGSQSAATTAGVATGAISVTNNNPSGFTAEGQSMITVAFRSTAPPTSWVGDFETGNFNQYAFVLEGASDRITIQTDTPRQGSRYARLFATDDDVYPLTPTDNPRASLVSPRLLYPGFERWIQWSTRFPVDFPTIPYAGWLVFFQYHGPPYTGSPSVGFGVEGDYLNIERNQTYNYDTIWSSPFTKGQWIDFVMRVNFQQDEAGFIELWMNGVSQVFYGGVRRLYMRTVELDQTTGLEIDPLIYRMRSMFYSASIDFDGVRFDATAPATLETSNAPPVRVLTGTSGTVRAKLGS